MNRLIIKLRQLMKKIALTICILFFTTIFCDNVIAQKSFGRHLAIMGRVFDPSNSYSYDIDKGFPIKIYIITSDIIRIYESYDGQFDLSLGYGNDYKIIISKTGYKSKLLIVEVRGSKKPDEFNYELPVEIELLPGLEGEKTELKPSVKIFYDSKKDYYEVMKF